MAAVSVGMTATCWILTPDHAKIKMPHMSTTRTLYTSHQSMVNCHTSTYYQINWACPIRHKVPGVSSGGPMPVECAPHNLNG